MIPLRLIPLAAAFCASASTFVAAVEHPKNPKIDPANFQETITNPYFPLVPGTVITYSESEKGDSRINVMTVTNVRKVILGVSCVVVHDTVTRNGAMVEDTYDWCAQDKDGVVWYFGEDTKEFEGSHINTEGSWEAGVGGAQPGIQTLAKPTVGEKYYQEYLKGQAEDQGQVVALDDTVVVTAGSYTGCLQTKDWTDLSAGTEKMVRQGCWLYPQ